MKFYFIEIININKIIYGQALTIRDRHKVCSKLINSIIINNNHIIYRCIYYRNSSAYTYNYLLTSKRF